MGSRTIPSSGLDTWVDEVARSKYGADWPTGHPVLVLEPSSEVRDGDRKRERERQKERDRN